MYDEINISDDCLRKVRNMERNNKKIKKFKIRYAAVAVVALALLTTSNVVSYAATGSGIAKHIEVLFTDDNGNKTELKETEKGKYIYEGEDETVQVQFNNDTVEKESIDANVDIDKNKNEINLKIDSVK